MTINRSNLEIRLSGLVVTCASLARPPARHPHGGGLSFAVRRAAFASAKHTSATAALRSPVPFARQPRSRHGIPARLHRSGGRHRFRRSPSPPVQARRFAATFPVSFPPAFIHARNTPLRVLYLCNENGFPSNKVDTRFHVGKYQFSAYLKSSYLAKIQADGLIELAEMDELVNLSIEEAQQAIKDYFRKCAADEAHSVVEEWKESKIYPYTGEATTAIETAERQVFDIVAVNVAHYIPEFEKTENKNKALHLQLLKQAIAKSPEDLQVILEEVLKLPKRKQAELAELLRDVSLASIINAAKTVADRLKFLSGLETILFDTQCKKNLKERSQLHRIIAQACWIMGEEYSLSVDDRSLNEVLRKHKKILREEIVIDEPVKPLYKSRGIVDLMLSKAIKGYKVNENKHLVVELKAPKVSVGLAEIGQIEEYALAVMNDERFRAINATWTFWVISDDYDDYAKMRMSDDGTGRIDNKKNGNFSIYVKTWAQILEDNRVRLKFFQDRLEYTAKKADAMKFLNDHYAKFLQGVIDDSALTEMNNTEEIESETVTEEITPD